MLSVSFLTACFILFYKIFFIYSCLYKISLSDISKSDFEGQVNILDILWGDFCSKLWLLGSLENKNGGSVYFELRVVCCLDGMS